MKLSLRRIFNKLKKEHKRRYDPVNNADSMWNRVANQKIVGTEDYYDSNGLEDPKQNVRSTDDDFEISDEKYIAQIASEIMPEDSEEDEEDSE